MNIGIVIAVIGLIAIAGFVFVSALQDEPDAIEGNDLGDCSTCGNSCTAENNCGRATCGAVSGGSCGCGG